MKQIFILLIIYITIPSITFGQNHTSAIEECIIANSGVDSIECLESIFFETKQDIIKLEKKIIDNIAKKQQTNSITETHYNLAISSLSDASENFFKFAEYQCNYSVGASGAVASGGSQINLSCLIQLNDWRIQYLETILAED